MDFGIVEEMKSKLAPSPKGTGLVVGIVAAIILVAVLGGRLLIDTATASDFQVERSSGESEAASGDDAHDDAKVFVHVAGCVVNPGLYELESPARVADAVNAAGGFSGEADETALNLARLVADGEQVVVPVLGDSSEAQGADGSSQPQQAGGFPVNVNSASADELQQVPGIGPSTAGKIVSDRQANGPFMSVDELTRVSGIGDKKLDSMRDYLCV